MKQIPEQQPINMKKITHPPHTLYVRIGENGWQILCQTNSPLSQLFTALTPCLQQEEINQITYNIYPVTNNLDNNIKTILDMLTAIRYQTNQVQLPLFTDALFTDQTKETQWP